MGNFTSKKTVALLAAALLGTASLQAQTVKKPGSGILISKVYYAGTIEKGGTKVYTGGEKYIVLHNNTNTEYDLAGMGIGLIESESSTGAWTAGSITTPSYAVALKQLYKIPDTNPVIIKPWGDLVIATSAINHTDLAEKGADLSKADFEFGGEDNDNADTPNLELLHTYNEKTTKVNLAAGGDAGVMIFSATNLKAIAPGTSSAYTYAQGKTSGSKYLVISGYKSMDAVEILRNKKQNDTYQADASRKRINNTQDAGYVLTSEAMYKDGFVAYRKTALNHDGNYFLYDTNNSTTDFTVSNTIQPTEYNTVADGTTEVKVTIPESGYLPFNAEKAFFGGKDISVAWVSSSATSTNFNSVVGDSMVCNASPFILVGTPGEHTIYYTEATRNLTSAGANNWISEDEKNYENGVYTVTTRNRYPMKFVNEKGNVRFVADFNDGKNQTLNIDVEKEGRFYIRLAQATTNGQEIKWVGVTPEEVVATGIEEAKAVTKKTNNAVYNLQGVKVNADKLVKGIYIQNGKKFVVK